MTLPIPEAMIAWFERDCPMCEGCDDAPAKSHGRPQC